MKLCRVPTGHCIFKTSFLIFQYWGRKLKNLNCYIAHWARMKKNWTKPLAASPVPIFKFLVSKMGFSGPRNSMEYFLTVCVHCKTSLRALSYQLL